MISRVSVFRLDTSFSCEYIYRVMLENIYSDEIGSGFIIDSFDGESISGSHIVKKTDEIFVEDPFGLVTSYKRDRYIKNNFRIAGDGLKVIELYNPERQVSSLREDLGKALSYKCAIYPKKIDLKETFLILKKNVEMLNVISADLDSIRPCHGYIGKLLIKGEKDVLEKIESFIGDNSYHLDKLGVSFLYGEEHVHAEFSLRGSVVFKSESITRKAKYEIVSMLHKS